MSVSTLFDDVKKEMLMIKHPLNNADSDIRLSYLAGIIILSTVNGEGKINDKLKKVLDELVLSLDLSEEVCSKTIENCLKPDKELIKEIVESLDQTYIQILFLLDAYTVLDKSYDVIIEEVKQIMLSFMQMFKFTETEYKSIEELKSHLFQKNYNEFSNVLSWVIKEDNTKNILLGYFFSNERREIKDLSNSKTEVKSVEIVSKTENICTVNNQPVNEIKKIDKIIEVEIDVKQIWQQIHSLDSEWDCLFNKDCEMQEKIYKYSDDIHELYDKLPDEDTFFSKLAHGSRKEILRKIKFAERGKDEVIAVQEKNHKQMDEISKKKGELEKLLSRKNENENENKTSNESLQPAIVTKKEEPHLKAIDSVIKIQAGKNSMAAIKNIDLGGGIVLEMVYIEPGKFIMGSKNCGDDASPPHEVAITKGFYMGKYPVTQEQWSKIMGSNPSHFKDKTPKHPVENVSWDDSQAFIQKMNGLKMYNGIFRLPTEAEWEYACRAGSTTEYYWGNDINEDYCWYDINSKGSTQPVGQKKPNDFGLYDMSGNVCEWCQDWYDANYYKLNDNLDPVGPKSGSNRVFRGDSWYGCARSCRSAYRVYSNPSYHKDVIGFRLALQGK